MTKAAADPVIILGAGHAGGEVATSLRQEGYEGRILMVGEEKYLPYQRPPLSKAFLSGEIGIDALSIKSQATYDKAQIEFIGSRRAEQIDRASKIVTLNDGTDLRYSKLVLATGGRPRPLAVAGSERAKGCDNFHYLRTIDDVIRIRGQFTSGKRLVIIGGGYVGLEVAAVAIKNQLHVTVLEAAPRVLARVTAPEISAFYEQVHSTAGVDLKTGVTVEQIVYSDSDNRVTEVVCSDGLRVSADLVILGIGLVPNVELAEAAGLDVSNGIVVDEHARTGDPNILAVGDCANYPNQLLATRVRLESVPNALEQARIAAATICDKQRPYGSMPWFWSDQYDLKLQMVGLSTGYDQVVLRGKPDEKSFVAFYLKEGCVIAADSVSRPKDFMFCKRLVADRAQAAPAVLADESISLKTILAASAA